MQGQERIKRYNMAYGTCFYCKQFAPIMQITGNKWICEDCFLAEQDYYDWIEMEEEMESENTVYEAEFGDGGWVKLPPEQPHE